mgnify:CR=1 FL=1
MFPEADGGGSEVDWRVRVSGHPQAMSEACGSAGLSPNALHLHELSLAEDGPTAEAASIEWPSYFCGKTDFVLVLAYLVRNHLPLDMEILLVRPSSGESRYQLHPPLDTHTRHLLSRINPRQAAALNDLQDRTEAVFERLRHGRLSLPE